MAKLGSDLEHALLFQGLSDEEFAFLNSHIVSHPFKPGDNLLVFGHEAPGIFVITSGLVGAVVVDESGSEREVATLGMGECVGEIALMTGERCSATVRAITDGEAQLLGRDDFLELMERYPGLWRNLGHILSQRLVRTSRQISQRSLTNAVSIVTDCAEGTAAVLTSAVASSLAAQTGKRVLVVDVRAGSSVPITSLSLEQPLPTLAALLQDGSLAEELQAAQNGPHSVRMTSITGQDQSRPSDEDCIRALELLAPHYDFLLLLEESGAGGQHPILLDRVRSLVALITDTRGAGIPPWVQALIDSPSARSKLEVAILTGDGFAATRLLENIESQADRTVVRLPFTLALLGDLAARPSEDYDVMPASLRKGIDRLARNVGQIEVGVALGAGAAKGFAHIGVLKTLEEHNIPVDYFAGCSIGAIVGAMYVGGLPFKEIEERMQGADRKVRRWHLPFRSVWSDAGLKELLRDPAPTARFRDLQTPFAVVTTDVATGREIVIRKGIVWRAVQASASVPGIFPPVLVQKRHLVDGGLVNPVPSQTVRDLGADIVIAVDLMSPSARTHHTSAPVNNSRGSARVPNLVEMLWRANEIMQEEVTLRSAATADITIEPRTGRVRWSDFSHRGPEFIALGEQAAREKLAELKRLLPGVVSASS